MAAQNKHVLQLPVVFDVFVAGSEDRERVISTIINNNLREQIFGCCISDEQAVKRGASEDATRPGFEPTLTKLQTGSDCLPNLHETS